MGTSASHGGAGKGSPLIPTWLDVPGDNPDNEEPRHDALPVDGEPSVEVDDRGAGLPPRVVPGVTPGGNFAVPKGAMTRSASGRAGGRSAMRKAVGGYVGKAAGGSRGATARMGSSRRSAGKLLGILRDVQSRGLRDVLQSLNLSALDGASAEDVFVGLAEHVLPTSGSIDAGIARDAYCETIAEVVAAGLESLENLSAAQVQLVYETFIANTIYAKLLNDIGRGMIQFAPDAQAVLAAQRQVKDFIRGAVRDAVASSSGNIAGVNPQQTAAVTGRVYELAFDLLQAYAEDENR